MPAAIVPVVVPRSVPPAHAAPLESSLLKCAEFPENWQHSTGDVRSKVPRLQTLRVSLPLESRQATGTVTSMPVHQLFSPAANAVQLSVASPVQCWSDWHADLHCNAVTVPSSAALCALHEEQTPSGSVVFALKPEQP